jgi:hypothetical protein
MANQYSYREEWLANVRSLPVTDLLRQAYQEYAYCHSDDSSPNADDWWQLEQLQAEALRRTNGQVSDLANEHRQTWRDMPETYWFQRLVGEIGELGCALAGEHAHSPDWELRQIAAICLNWLDMRGDSADLGIEQ